MERLMDYSMFGMGKMRSMKRLFVLKINLRTTSQILLRPCEIDSRIRSLS